MRQLPASKACHQPSPRGWRPAARFVLKVRHEVADLCDSIEGTQQAVPLQVARVAEHATNDLAQLVALQTPLPEVIDQFTRQFAFYAAQSSSARCHTRVNLDQQALVQDPPCDG